MTRFNLSVTATYSGQSGIGQWDDGQWEGEPVDELGAASAQQVKLHSHGIVQAGYTYNASANVVTAKCDIERSISPH
jgi:hypothetical protein